MALMCWCDVRWYGGNEREKKPNLMNTSRLFTATVFAVLAPLTLTMRAEPLLVVPRYHSAQRPDQPPLPFNPRPELPVVDLGQGTYVFDDTMVDYGELMMSSMNSSVPSPPGGGGGGGGGPIIYAPPTVPIPGVPLLNIELFDGAKIVSFTTIPGLLYRVEQTSDLNSASWTTIREFVATADTSSFTVEDNSMAFYRVYQEDDTIQFPNWFDSVYQYMRFDVYTPIADGTYTLQLYADDILLESFGNTIPPDGKFGIHDSGYDPTAWPNTGEYQVEEWELHVTVAPTGAAGATRVVRKRGKQRSPGTYKGMAVQQSGRGR
jgi:hypothetical protein